MSYYEIQIYVTIEGDKEYDPIQDRFDNEDYYNKYDQQRREI